MAPTPNTRIAYGMGIYDQHGKLQFVEPFCDEDRAWTLFLGWPSPEEIQWKKDQGFHCQKVVIARR